MIRFSLLISFLIIFSISCKKGENDPTLSLRTRKARITGNWELKSQELTHTYHVNSIDSSIKEVYSNQVLTHTGASGKSAEYNYLQLLKINKEGTYELLTDWESYRTSEKGYWTWTGEMDELDVESKEIVLFQKTSEIKTDVISGEVLQTETYSGLPGTEVYIEVLDELRNDQMTFTYNSTSTFTNGDKYSIAGFKIYTKYN